MTRMTSPVVRDDQSPVPDENILRLVLPDAPPSETGAVKAWYEPVRMRTYAPAAPDKNPMFLEKRVYQGSSGSVYPLPVIDRIDTIAHERLWDAVHIENEELRVMILPEIGGRIHVGLDKTNGYDFFYRQNVIRPALVGLAGPWISGGVEFNWQQHHRPATYMPVETAIERGDDGSVTVWCSDHDPLQRMKGMHGVCLRPGKAYIELRVRLHNRTMDMRTFLWWANVAVSVHERYQSFFPGDVQYVADHAKRAVTEFPLSEGIYYGVDYGSRPQHGIPPSEQPSRFAPDGTFALNDLSSFANIPVPTSYMVSGSRGDFAGGYDFKREAGVISVANRHIVPGKKQWTWGNHDFGYAWERNLTETDGPYIELMVGAFTDNQPDFSFLAPGETKSFRQFWYPLREIGIPDAANLDAAMRLCVGETKTSVHLQVTSARAGAVVTLLRDAVELGRWEGDLQPSQPVHLSFPSVRSEEEVEVRVEQEGALILRYKPADLQPADAPQVAVEPPMPAEVATIDELYLIGLHLEQYRHPTRQPELYWREGLRRDAEDSRVNHALGRWHLRRGEFDAAERHLRTCIRRATQRNSNPYDGEPLYYLGLTLLFQDRRDEAYDFFYKATWNAAWRGPAYLRLAEIDCARKRWSEALEHVEQSLRADAENLNALNLKVLILRARGLKSLAAELLTTIATLDPLDNFSRFLASGEVPLDGQRCLDLVFDLARGGFYEEALRILHTVPSAAPDGAATIMLYVKADLLRRAGQDGASRKAQEDAAQASSDYVFPSRLEEMILLQRVMAAHPSDARASFYLGNFLFDRRRHHEAIRIWERSAEQESHFSIVWRNLAFGYFNILSEPQRAQAAMRRAFELAPGEPRILYEYDQLLKRTGISLEDRLHLLRSHEADVLKRDDLTVEFASLLNSAGDPAAALQVLLSRRFQPWEGGEGLVLSQYVRANLLLAHHALRRGDPKSAQTYLLATAAPPRSLGEVRHPLSNEAKVLYWLGVAYAALELPDEAQHAWELAARARQDFQRMQVQAVSESTLWSALALEKLGRYADACAVVAAIQSHAEALEHIDPKIDYFATSLPTMLLFEEDLAARNHVLSTFLKAQVLIALTPEVPEAGFAQLETVLRLDCAHEEAIDLLRLMKG